MIELPFSHETIPIHDLTLYIKSEFRNLNEPVLQIISKSIHQQLDKQPQIFYLLRLIFNENYLSQQKKKFDFIDLNIEEILNTYIGKIFI